MVKKKRAVFTVKPLWYRTRWDKIIYLIILGCFIVVSPGQNIYSIGTIVSGRFFRTLPIAQPEPAPYPENRTGAYPGSDISATGIVIYDIDSGVYLYKRNENELLAPASTTKIMTALVALDAYTLDDVVTVKTVSNNGQTMGLFPGERITVENLLFGALVHSGNDAAYTLAEHYSGGVQAFVQAMNVKAKALHLDNSMFTNSVGYDNSQHKMTPMDLARLGSIALKNSVIAKMVAIPQITVSDVTHTYFHPLKNVNELLGKIPGVGGIKTGWTEEAGENLITLVERDGHKIIIVLLRSRDRFGETAKLIDWVFSNYEWAQLSPTADR
jgi:D-alanyl-D-alanine carboxypeptidase